MRPPRAGLLAVAAFVAAAGVAAAAVTWSATSQITLGTASPPYMLQEGSGASLTRYVADFQLSANQTSFSITLGGKAGGTMSVKDVVRILNPRASPVDVTLRGAHVGAAGVERYEWEARDGGSKLATLDMKSASPSAQLVVPAGATLELDLRLKLTKGAGQHNASAATSVWSVLG